MLKKYCLSIIYIFATTAASAHITLEQPTAAVESTYKAVFRVGHGCDGSATKSITVFMPVGITGAKPMPKAGWTLDIKIEKLDKPYDSHGTLITERASQVTWSGGTLPDNQYDEFVARMTLPSAPDKVYFRVLQICEKGQTDWAEMPVEGKGKPKTPPAMLEVIPASASEHMHH